MHSWKGRGLLLGWSLFAGSFVCGLGLADDKNKGNDKTVATNADGTESRPEAGWTSRERWLLDRVEELERRVAELEAREKPNVPATTGGGAVAASATAAGIV